MRLADFIERNVESVIAEWVTFARASGPAARTMDLHALRDHAAQMLQEIVVDLRTPQTAAEQTTKSKGAASVDAGKADTAAEVHGAGRAESGFSVAEMTSEYRALRASVIRLWTKAQGSLTGEDLEDLMRFNEAIDQSLAESISRFTEDIDRARELFIAILGHELRAPLATVLGGSQLLADDGGLAEPQRAAATRVARGARRMDRMISDLLDFTWGRLGSGIPISRTDADLVPIVRAVLDETIACHPTVAFQFTPSGDLRGSWDAARLGQMVATLLENAVQHGRRDTRISVTVQGEPADVVLRIHNHGAPMPAADQVEPFSPFKRFQSGGGATRESGDLGLGLYIAERIVTAHGGTIDVRSSTEAGTLFSVRLPR